MTAERRNISSGAPWEEKVGYSRAVRVGSLVFVAGTLACDEQGAIHGQGDAHAQTVYALRKIERALAQAGASLADVVRTRMFVTDIAHQEAVGRGHKEVMGGVMPAATLVQVGPLAHPFALVEIEADAVVSGSGAG
ncbi:MAG: RidA family protein [Phycisphaerales bacterium]|nr:RidA family protein [Phycisphaerales bacterium]